MSIYGVTDIWTYAIGALGIILLPGPNSLLVLSVASARGVKTGYRAALGVFVGDTILLLLTAMGAATLLRTYPSLFVVVKYVGAAYLAWLGVHLIRNAWRQGCTRLAEVKASADAAQPQVGLADPFQHALVMSLLNPKAILPLRHEDPELRRKHLEWIRRVVAAGEYRVPSEDVARAIIGFYRRAE